MLENTKVTNSQRKRILDRLEKGLRVTSLDAYNVLGVTQLGARIFELRHEGYPIKSVRTVGNNRFGEKIHYCEYVLEKEEE